VGGRGDGGKRGEMTQTLCAHMNKENNNNNNNKLT
jgi:hypothetical protein